MVNVLCVLLNLDVPMFVLGQKRGIWLHVQKPFTVMFG